MAWIAAGVLAEHLELAGFVVMKKPPSGDTTPARPKPG